jgi:hypothetical protein
MKLARLADKLAFSNVVACLALFIALGGAAVAASTVAKNSVGTKQLKANAVTAAKIKNGAVNSHKLAHGAVVAGKIGGNSIASGNLQNGSVIAAKLGKGSVTNPAIAHGVVGTNKLGNAVVTAAKLANNSVTNPAIANDSITPSKLAPEFGPILGTLKSGQTLRGNLYIAGYEPETAGNAIAGTSASFQFPLLNAPNPNVIDPKTATTPSCPGITGGNGQTPEAAAGQLCIYITEKTNAATIVPVGTVNRLGFALQAKAGTTKGEFSVIGQWAVTAP